METESTKKNPLDSMREAMSSMKEMEAENIRLSNLKDRTSTIAEKLKVMGESLIALAKELNPAVTMQSKGMRNMKPVFEVLSQKISEGCNITNELISATISSHGLEENESDIGQLRFQLRQLPGVDKGGEHGKSYLFMKGT